jgi:hypothetical protein
VSFAVNESFSQFAGELAVVVGALYRLRFIEQQRLAAGRIAVLVEQRQCFAERLFQLRGKLRVKGPKGGQWSQKSIAATAFLQRKPRYT